MVIMEDTRQQVGKHDKKREYFESQGVQMIRNKLPFGDYALAPEISVDTKASIHEITNNLCGDVAERQRFIRECKAAKSAGCQLVFLVEVGKYKSPADLMGHDIKLKSGKVIKGEQVFRAMAAVSARYGCRFEFSPPGKSAARIMEILGEENERERIHQTQPEDPEQHALAR